MALVVDGEKLFVLDRIFIEEEFFVLYRISFAGLVFTLVASVSPCQQTSPSDPSQPGVAKGTEDSNPPPHESKRILAIIPNYRTSPTLQNSEPLSTTQKFNLPSH